MYVQLIKDVALLVALTSLHSLLTRLRATGRIWPQLLSGLLFGAVAVAGMAVPFQYQPGIIYDGRSIVLALSGLFGGWITGLVSVVVAGTYRAVLGGVGIWAGLASIVGPAILGLAFRRASGDRPDRLSIFSLYGMGIAAHVLMLACQLLLPWPRGLEVISRIWLPVMLIFPAATLLIAFLLKTEERRILAESALRESEDRFKNVFEAANVGKSITLPSGEINVNRAFCDMLGYSPEELRSRRWQELTLPEDIEGIDRILEPLLRGEKDSARFNRRYICRDGALLWADVSVVMRRDRDGRPLHFISTIVDITDRRRAEDELRERESRYRTLFDESPVAIWEEDFSAVKARFDQLRRAGVTDLNAHFNSHPEEVAALAALVRVVSVNARSVKLFGAESREALPREVSKYLTPEALPVFRDEMVALFRGETTFSAEISNVSAAGVPLLLELSLAVPPEHAEDLAGVLVCFIDVTERRAAQEALALSEANLHSLLASTEDIVVSRDRDGRVVAFNEAFARITRDMFGVEAAQGLQTADYLDAEGRARWMRTLAKVLGGERLREEFSWQIGGRTRHFEMTLTPIRSGEAIIGTAEFTRDITERKRTEEHLLQAQKMETVGQLAGGVAHDFNNMLQVILSYVDMSMGEVPAGGQLAQNLREVRRAALRSSDLTGQLLAFARRQTVSPRLLDLNEAVAGTRTMIQRLIGEDIDLAWMPGRDLWKVKIDPVQLDQVLANLAVNARDAIGGVGRLTIETANTAFDAAYCAEHPGFIEGEYVLLAVSDDGKGMDRETMSHLFEPFFTTKIVGKGTGLGLATIYGIVKQNKGFINAYSEVGQGSTFKVYLPRVPEETQAVAAGDAGAARPVRGGTETVLVVEDEAAILRLVREGLGALGYTVLMARSPDEALALSSGRAEPIHILITDVVMPLMNGRELAERLRAQRAGLKCLFMSGYTANVIAHRGVLDEGVSFLAKPFTLSTLAAKVREVLEG